MSLTTIIISAAGLAVGLVLGYYLRLVISLGKKGSMELEIKKMMISAKEESQKVLEDAKKKAEEKSNELRQEEKKKEEEFRKTEDRFIKKEGLLDSRQVEIDKEVESIKIKIEEIKKAREKVEGIEKEKVLELEKLSHLTETEAKEELYKIVERKSEEDMLVRMQKLEVASGEKLERRAKIEEEVKKSQDEINRIIKEKGEQAAYECGILNLDPRILAVVGRLYFRTSYGQNVLQHSIEMAHISRMLAEELGADPNIAAAGALTHDIGKALDHEVQGTHIDIGIRILQKFGADKKIIYAMKRHHGDYPHESLESIIVTTADSISGGRPGARRDTVENYLKRLADLEAIAKSFSGIEKSYALQAGREIRVFVKPEEISDIEAKKLARDVALRIENELKYPGEIKVTIIRENRVIEY